MNVTPALSIVVNNYNYGKYISESLDSALAQMNTQDELIVVDDGSTDASRGILETYHEQHGAIVIQQENSGQMKTVRVGIEIAQGEIVVLLDSDDCFLPGYLDRVRETFAAQPKIDFLMSAPQVGGDANANIDETRGVMERMELTPGPVGTTRWATLLFYEYVGVPTSGVALRTDLAKSIMTLPANLDSTRQLSPLFSKTLRIPEKEARRYGYSADAVIVRCASILGAFKYYDETPAFFYRIHGENKYASSSTIGRWYLRKSGQANFTNVVSKHFGIPVDPSATEIREEVLRRSYGKRRRRRFTVRLKYCAYILVSKGTLGEKASALWAAMGCTPAKPHA